jgi:hypothetical protein
MMWWLKNVFRKINHVCYLFYSLITVRVIVGIKSIFSFSYVRILFAFNSARSPSVSTTVDWSSDSITCNSRGSRHGKVPRLMICTLSVNGESKHRSYLGNLCCWTINAEAWSHVSPCSIAKWTLWNKLCRFVWCYSVEEVTKRLFVVQRAFIIRKLHDLHAWIINESHKYWQTGWFFVESCALRSFVGFSSAFPSNGNRSS